LLISIPTLKDQ